MLTREQVDQTFKNLADLSMSDELADQLDAVKTDYDALRAEIERLNVAMAELGRGRDQIIERLTQERDAAYDQLKRSGRMLGDLEHSLTEMTQEKNRVIEVAQKHIQESGQKYTEYEQQLTAVMRERDEYKRDAEMMSATQCDDPLPGEHGEMVCGHVEEAKRRLAQAQQRVEQLERIVTSYKTDREQELEEALAQAQQRVASLEKRRDEIWDEAREVLQEAQSRVKELEEYEFMYKGLNK